MLDCTWNTYTGVNYLMALKVRERNTTFSIGNSRRLVAKLDKQAMACRGVASKVRSKVGSERWSLPPTVISSLTWLGLAMQAAILPADGNSKRCSSRK